MTENTAKQQKRAEAQKMLDNAKQMLRRMDAEALMADAVMAHADARYVAFQWVTQPGYQDPDYDTVQITGLVDSEGYYLRDTDEFTDDTDVLRQVCIEQEIRTSDGDVICWDLVSEFLTDRIEPTKRVTPPVVALNHAIFAINTLLHPDASSADDVEEFESAAAGAIETLAKVREWVIAQGDDFVSWND
ncbi:MAG: hypothetical protein ABIQ39_15630 [Ilumatobacteraceae bacterium]